MSEEKQYNIGDLIVHTHYGVGEIVNIEEKELFGKAAQYYVVETANSTYWLPVEKEDSDRIRPIADSKEILEVIRTLEDDPEEMQADHKDRKQQIRKAKATGELHSIAALIRDLSYHQAKKHLTATEEKAFEKLKDRLVNEWAASKQTTTKKVRARLNKIFSRFQQE